jgi:hypothetical protein
MRKWIVLLLFFVVLCLAAVYLLIPNTVSLQQKEHVFFPAKAFSKGLLNIATWQQWWPGEKGSMNFRYNQNEYTITEKKFSSLRVSISNGTASIQTELILIPVETDSIELDWLGATGTSLNPVDRIQKSRWVKSVATDISSLLEKMEAFYTNPDHLYSSPVKEATVVDSMLISTSVGGKQYPTTALIYGLLDKLKAYAEKNGARQTGLPMLNISRRDDSGFLTRVALPVDKKLKDEGDIQYRWMLGGGNILVTEVKGGPHQVEKAFTVLEEYIADFKRIAPAIPFQSLVTDRRSEPDTSKWITKVYWPVM